MKSADSREVAVRKYFKPTPEKPSYAVEVILMIAGGILLVVCLGTREAAVQIILLVAALGLGLRGAWKYYVKRRDYMEDYNECEPKPSDEQMDRWLDEDLGRIRSEAGNKLGVVPEQLVNLDDPLVVVGPQKSAKWKIGEDEIFRFSGYEVVVIYLSNYHLGAYTCDLDMHKGLIGREETQEYHYTDVVSVATVHSDSRFTLVDEDGTERTIPSQQMFSLSVASGESIRIAVAFPHIEDILRHGELRPSGADKAVSQIRTMLREKKGGIVGG